MIWATARHSPSVDRRQDEQASCLDLCWSAIAFHAHSYPFLTRCPSIRWPHAGRADERLRVTPRGAQVIAPEGRGVKGRYEGQKRDVCCPDFMGPGWTASGTRRHSFPVRNVNEALPEDPYQEDCHPGMHLLEESVLGLTLQTYPVEEVTDDCPPRRDEG